MKEEDNVEKTEPVLDNEELDETGEELDEMDDEDGESGGGGNYFNPKKSVLVVLAHREKKQFVFEQILSKIRCYVEQSHNQFYIDKIRFDHPEPIAQLKKVVMTVNKAISHYKFFMVEPVDDSHAVYEQVGLGIKYHLLKSPNYQKEGYYLDKISIEQPVNLNSFRSATIACLYSSSRAIFRARDAAILVHKDGDKAMYDIAYRTCGDKEMSEEAVTLAHTYLKEYPKIMERLERLYARQADKLSFFQKWFHL